MISIPRIITAVILILLGLQDETVSAKILPSKVFSHNSRPKHNSPSQAPQVLQELEPKKNGFVKAKSICSATPKISIISYSRDEFLPNETVKTELIDLSDEVDGNDKVWMAPFAAEVEILCVAEVPIQWTFDGPLEPEVLSIDVAREIDALEAGDSSINPKSCFRLVMKLMTRKRSTGRYKCEEIQSAGDKWKRNAIASVYLYGEANGPPFLLYQGKEFNVFQTENSQKVVLPCQVVNPTITPQLYKGNSLVVSIDGSVPFDAQIGFTLDLHKIPKPFDLYKCSREGGSVSTNVKPLPDFRVIPSSPRVTVVDGNTLTLTCEAIFPVGFEGFIDESKVTIIKDENAPLYKYKITYDFLARGKGETGISCVDLKSKSTLHTWTTTVISSKRDLESGIRYDTDLKRFYCFAKTNYPPTIALAQCNSIMECQLTQKCFSWDTTYKLVNGGNNCFSEEKLQRGNNCDEGDRKRFNVSEDIGCAYVLNSNDAGIVQCSLHDNRENIQMYYFNGIKSGADVVISDWKEGPTAELIDITVLEQNRTFYTQELIEFDCAVSKFVFARGQIFRFKLENGSYIVPNEIVRDADDGEDSMLVKTSKLKLSDHKIKEVICISPFWNQTGWMSNSIPISVKASVPPKILDLPKSMFVKVGVNVSVTCTAEGLPIPKVGWYRNGKRAESQFVHLNPIEKTNTATLIIDPVNPDDSGDYECEATNVAGTATVKMDLVVSPNKSGVYAAIIIGFTTFTVFLIIVIYLWRKLRKNQAIVRRLTEKEEKSFRHGDLDALRSIPDGYIRAQYLPYDKQYEIKEENLQFDGDQVLGTGEFGIVRKATLCLNNARTEVAVKTRRSPDVNHFKSLLTELKMLTYIGWHDNVINLLGAVTRNLRGGDVYVVMEYCRLGDLESFLRTNRASFLNQIVNEKLDLNLSFSFNSQQNYQPVEYTMSSSDLISWAHQISGGMEYLANKKVIHGDLAARNILLTEDKTVKITDFGLSKHLYNGSNYISHSNMNLPWKHCAPEILHHNSYSTQSDVWSMGVTLWEMFSLGAVPYMGIAFNWDFKNKLLEGLRLDKPSAANQDIYNVILKCWKNTPAERISFRELRRYFHRVLHHCTDEETPDDNMDEDVSIRRMMGGASSPQTIENHYVANPTYQPQRIVHYTAMA